MNGNLLIDTKPLLLIPELAIKIGLNESIILQQLHYWLQRSKNIRNDRKWVYFTYNNLAEQFPFFSVSTIRRAITNLESKGFLYSDNFNKMRMDQTKWYTIMYENVHELNNFCPDSSSNNFELTSLNYHEDEKSSPPLKEETICSEGTYDVLMMDNPSVQNEQMRCSTWTDDVPSLNKAIPEVSTESTTENTSEISSSSYQANEKENEKDPYRFFVENGFGTVGSFYSKKIKSWCVKLSIELVIKAMKLALENGSNRWNYVEAILKDWFNKGYKTDQEILDAKVIFKKQKKEQCTKKPIRKEHIPDWLQNEERPDKPLYNLAFEEKKRLFEERLTSRGSN